MVKIFLQIKKFEEISVYNVSHISSLLKQNFRKNGQVIKPEQELELSTKKKLKIKVIQNKKIYINIVVDKLISLYLSIS